MIEYCKCEVLGFQPSMNRPSAFRDGRRREKAGPTSRRAATFGHRRSLRDDSSDAPMLLEALTGNPQGRRWPSRCAVWCGVRAAPSARPERELAPYQAAGARYHGFHAPFKFCCKTLAATASAQQRESGPWQLRITISQTEIGANQCCDRYPSNEFRSRFGSGSGSWVTRRRRTDSDPIPAVCDGLRNPWDTPLAIWPSMRRANRPGSGHVQD